MHMSRSDQVKATPPAGQQERQDSTSLAKRHDAASKHRPKERSQLRARIPMRAAESLDKASGRPREGRAPSSRKSPRSSNAAGHFDGPGQMRTTRPPRQRATRVHRQGLQDDYASCSLVQRRCSVTRRQALPMWTEAQLARSLEQPGSAIVVFI
jgi:hypothetical protein